MNVCPSCKVRYKENIESCSRCGSNLVAEISEKSKSPQKGNKANLLLFLGLLSIPVAFIITAIFYLGQKATDITSNKVSQPAHLVSKEDFPANNESDKLKEAESTQEGERVEREIKPSLALKPTSSQPLATGSPA